MDKAHRVVNSLRISLILTCAAVGICRGRGAQAQTLWSFETGVEGWQATGYGDSDFISVGTSTSGATAGAQSLVVETGPTYGWDVSASVSAVDTARYDAFNAVAANPGNYSLDFDVTITPESFASTANPGNFFLVSIAANSDLGWQQALNVTPNLAGLTGTFPVSIPMSSLPVAENSSFYQFNLGSNSDHVNGNSGQGVKYFIDNLRFTPQPVYVEQTLFSWETPDNPSTPTIDERFEGWTPGFGTGHVHSIVTQGATDGTYALQIDRSSRTSPNFTWGSQFVLSSDTDPDPEVEVIDPTLQASIDDLVSQINGAKSLAFDVRIGPYFPYSPGFAKFGLHLSDENGTFYDAEGASFNAPLEGDAGTVVIDLADMIDNTSGLSLAQAGLVEGTSFLRIGLSTNTDGPGLYQIDNLRVIREVSSETADFDEDGSVDGADFLAWQRGFATGTSRADGDANGDGMVDAADLTVWQDQFGTAPALGVAIHAVPEPSSVAIAAVVSAVACVLRRKFVP